jgi:YD repeat-containing protein
VLDQLTYNYAKDGSGKLLNNQLQYVQDAVSTPALEDVENQNAGNYSYDAIGNLTADVQSNISSISWSPYGKPLQISKTNSSTVKFGYDASGNRVSKEQGNRTTYFVRDTSGNTMATYVKEPVDNATPELRLTEQPIYGSTKIGQRQVSLPLGAGPLALLQNLLVNHF